LWASKKGAAGNHSRLVSSTLDYNLPEQNDSRVLAGRSCGDETSSDPNTLN
jgi:hypothetical protein